MLWRHPLERDPRVVYGTSKATLKGLGLPQIDLAAEEVAGRSSFGGFEALARRIGGG